MIERIFEKLKERKRNTKTIKRHLQAILSTLTENMPDPVSGYTTKNIFTMKASFWNGRDWVHFCGEGRFAIIDGDATIVDSYGSSYNIDDIDYLNFTECMVALEEFIQKLSNITTWSSEVEKLEKIAKILRGEV